MWRFGLGHNGKYVTSQFPAGTACCHGCLSLGSHMDRKRSNAGINNVRHAEQRRDNKIEFKKVYEYICLRRRVVEER
jgi:hypothetical protein